jgi:hypothetical protein
MYEFHGWITVRETYENRDTDDNVIKNIVEKINNHISQINWPHGVLGIRPINVEYYIWMVGASNHQPTGQYDPVEFFKYIANIAPGSYGLLYVIDHNKEDNKFRVYALSRGQLSEYEDPFLSPYIPKVESFPMD